MIIFNDLPSLDTVPDETIASFEPRARRAEPRAPRISDVARLAGVSTATVSMVMNNSPRISRPTALRVRRTAERLGYRPNRAAQALRGFQTRTLAAILPAAEQGMADLYIGEILNGIRETARAMNYRLLLEQPTEKGISTFSNRSFDAHDVDANLCIGCAVADVPHELLDLPLMLVDSRPARSQIDHVTCDYRGAMTQAVEHLTQIGHRNIALIHAATPDRHTSELRAAWRDATSTQAQAFRPGCPIFDAPADEKGGSSAAADLLDSHPDVTAIVADDDRMALGVLHQLALRRLDVPRDISVITLGDLGPAAFATPALTAVRLPLRAVGAAACQAMIKRLAGEAPHTAQLIPTQLILRHSTGPALELRAL